MSQEAEAVISWSEAIFEAIAPVAAIIKPQSAFFESLGSDGLRALRIIIDAAHSTGLLVLLDAKRSDIGSTAEAYAKSAFGDENLKADAMTVVPMFGFDGLLPYLRYVETDGKGLFVIVHSSNPTAVQLQDQLLADGRPYYQLVGDLVAKWGEPYVGMNGYSSVGAVIGATYPEQLIVARKAWTSVPFLVPGYGAQGAGGKDVVGAFDPNFSGAVVAASRSISGVYDRDEIKRDDFIELVRGRVRDMADDVRTCFEASV